MTTKQYFSAFMAVFALIHFPAKAFAQAQDENRLSIPIEMVVNAGTSQERQQTSQYGTMDPVALRPNEQVAITLIASVSLRGSPVGIAPLDGGAIFGADTSKPRITTVTALPVFHLVINTTKIAFGEFATLTAVWRCSLITTSVKCCGTS